VTEGASQAGPDGRWAEAAASQAGPGKRWAEAAASQAGPGGRRANPADDPAGADHGAAPRRARLNLVIVIVATVGVLQLLYLNWVESDRMLVLRRDVARLEADVGRLQAEERVLLDVAAHGDDLAFREQLARLQGFIGPDELRVVTSPLVGAD